MSCEKTPEKNISASSIRVEMSIAAIIILIIRVLFMAITRSCSGGTHLNVADIPNMGERAYCSEVQAFQGGGSLHIQTNRSLNYQLLQ